MKNILSIFIICTFALILIANSSKAPRYDPTWESLESRPLPSWFDSVKIGIFMLVPLCPFEKLLFEGTQRFLFKNGLGREKLHWGVFSVPAFGGYEDYKAHYAAWFWNDWHYGSADHVKFMKENYPPNFTYQDFAPQFHAEFYDPYNWAKIFNKAGAKYVVLTSKHHEGYSLYPSKYSFSWNSGDVGPKRDLVGDLANAIRETTDIKFGLYHSRYEWFNPLYMSDQESQFHVDEFVRFKTLPELYEIVNLYKPDIVWSDGDWTASSDYWQSKEFLAWLYNESPVNETVITNDRWGNETLCKHGGFMTCADNYNPGVLQPHKWENCMTLDKYAFSHRRNTKIEDYRTPEQIIQILVETVSCGGNLLVNVGPSAEGMIVPVQEERLLQLGEWLDLNGEAIYDTVPWTVQNDTITPGVWYTSNPSKGQVYAIVLNWPGQRVHLGAIEPSAVGSIGIFGSQNTLTWTAAGSGITVDMPRPDENQSKWAWTIVINEAEFMSNTID